MPFAIFIPGWNSLDSVRRVHSDLELIALVFFALLVLFEVLAFLEKEHTKKTLLEKIGLWFFAVAVLAELIAYPYGQRNDTLSGNMIVSLDAKAGDADSKAKEALADSLTTLSKAKDANDAAEKAAGVADTAKSIADDAKAGAEDAARQVVNLQVQTKSLQRDIDAEKEEMKRLKTDRRITDALGFIAPLKQFAGTEYSFSVYGNAESGSLMSEIDVALGTAGWKRVQAPLTDPITGAPAIAITFVLANGTPESIPVNDEEGIRVSISEESMRPAAAQLVKALFSNIYPPDDNPKRNNVDFSKRESVRIVRIVVGSKPVR